MDTLLIAFVTTAFGAVLILSALGSIRKPATRLEDSGCGTDNLRARIAALVKTHPRLIAVVGDGVPGEALVRDRPYNTQFAQGYDLYQGVNHALQSPALREILKTVGVLFIDDGGNSACAAKIAEILATEPRLLGVIGHSTTSCTNAALEYYQRANIPFVIPAATNPELLSGAPANCFRLPSNDKIQALVVADVVLNQLRAGSVFIVWDATPEAALYSEYLKNAIQHHLTTGKLLNSRSDNTSPIIEGSYPISLNPLNYSYLFRRIVSSQADVVIFAGYGSLAREFLLGLSREYSEFPEEKKPRVILTDGCKIPGIQGYGFETYLTFAAKPLKNLPAFATFAGGATFPEFRKMYGEESFEVFGYDAAVLMLTAITDSPKDGGRLSRRRINHVLASRNQLPATAYQYSFEHGENTLHRYYCYSLGRDATVLEYTEYKINSLLKQAADR